MARHHSRQVKTEMQYSKGDSRVRLSLTTCLGSGSNSLSLLDFSEFVEAEVTHISQNKVAAADFDDEFLADGFVLLGGGGQGMRQA